MDYLVFDIVIALFLLVCLWRGYTRGFILTLCSFLAIFVAFIGASIVSDFLAEPVARTIEPLVQQGLQQFFQEHAIQDILLDAELSIDQALSVLQESDLFQAFAPSIDHAVAAGLVDTTLGIVQGLAQYLALRIAHILLFVTAFLFILAIWLLLSHALDLAFRLPVLSTLNHWSGALLGLLKGGLWLFIAARLLKDSLIPPAAIDQTYLLQFFCTIDPLAMLLSFSF